MDFSNTVVLELKELGAKITSVALNYNRCSDEKYYYQHRHRDYELHYVEYGSCVMYGDSEYYHIEKGKFCLFGPGVYHSQKTCTDSFNKVCVSFYISSGKNPAAQRLAGALERCRVLTGSGANLLPAMELLRHEIAEDKAFAVEAVKALLSLIILELARQAAGDGEKAGAMEKSGLDELRGLLIDEFFNDNFNLSAGDEILAQKLGVSRRQLNRILKDLYGKSYREKLMETRAEVAVDFLLNSSRSISEISELMGYSTPANFSSFFKNVSGMTPSELRQGASAPISLPHGGKTVAAAERRTRQV